MMYRIMETPKRKGAAHNQDAAAPVVPAQGTHPYQSLGNQAVVSLMRSGLGSGQELSADDRHYFEPRLGTDLSQVRVHRDTAAAGALGARAFAAGRDIGFAAGAWQPGASEGRRLLAHELVHVAQSARGTAAGKPLSEPGDAAECEANAAADAMLAGRTMRPLQAPAASIARQMAMAMYPPTPWRPAAVFEPPAAHTPAGAIVAFDAYLALDAAGQQEAFDISFPSGNLAAALRALDPALAQKPPYLVPVQDLLRKIEGRETSAEAGQTDAQMATTQANFMRANPDAPKGGGWGGAAPGKTRWAGMTAAQQQDWTRRGNAAIALMVAHAATAAPNLLLTAASFELDFEKVDSVSLGAFAVGGSRPGETVAVGFEFVVICEVNPAYALSTVEHELHGHPVFDAAGPNTGGRIYAAAAAQVPGSPAGNETYEYYPSEIYSLLREIPLWVATSAADAGKSVATPGKTSTIKDLNPDPRNLIAWHVREMKTKWAPSLLEPMLRGFWQRISADPGIAPAALTAFAAVLTRVLGPADAGRITR
jgi:hypothetical protein